MIAIYDEQGKLIRVSGPKVKRLELTFTRNGEDYSSATSSMASGLLRQGKPKAGKESSNGNKVAVRKHAPSK